MRISVIIASTATFVALSSTAYGGDPAWLADLNRSEPSSLCIARERFLSRFPATSEDQAQGLFELWDFYAASISANQSALDLPSGSLVGEQFFEVTAALRDGKTDVIDAMFARIPSVKQRMAPFLACGYSIVVDFDDTIMFNSAPTFLRVMQDQIQPRLWAYVELYLKQNPDRLDYDGGLAIPWEALRARIRRWERLRDENRAIVPLITHMDSALHFMFELYLCGLPNSLPFDDYGRMEDEARTSYEQFVRLNTGSREYELVVNALANLEKHDWRLNQELIQLYSEHGYSANYLKGQLGQLHQ